MLLTSWPALHSFQHMHLMWQVAKMVTVPNVRAALFSKHNRVVKLFPIVIGLQTLALAKPLVNTVNPSVNNLDLLTLFFKRVIHATIVR